MSRNYWAHTPRPHAMQREALQWEACEMQLEKKSMQQQGPSTVKNKINKIINIYKYKEASWTSSISEKFLLPLCTWLQFQLLETNFIAFAYASP